jgi:ATP-dependent Clp protease ATP-binding subunit ClpC
MGLARDEASRLHHEYIGTEHILLGIASESVGVAAEALKSFGITLDQVRSGVESLIGRPSMPLTIWRDGMPDHHLL